MEYKTIELDEFIVAGISVRTTNQDARAYTDIRDLWARFMHEGILEKIPHRVSDDLYCVYTDYESDYTGAYTTILGCEVTKLADLPDGIIGKVIPKSQYQVYTSDNVAGTWQHIWSQQIARKYEADFDLYPSSPDEHASQDAITYVSILGDRE